MKLTGESLITGILAAAIVIFILIAGVVILILVARRQRLAQQLKEANYQTRINEISFASLRSQMNPHFIFNCLNSIKYFTEQNKNEEASAYLGKFAGLLRSTLDNARCEKITLREEIDSLQLYLDLESMRFKDRLSYEFIVQDNVDTEFAELPPMIVQPYVENAIRHGLLPRAAGGKLVIEITQDDDSAIRIRVSDNGIGRRRAAEKKMQADTSHVSVGTRITAERISLLNEKFPGSAEISINDDTDEQGEAAGTTVIIKLPLI